MTHIEKNNYLNQLNETIRVLHGECRAYEKYFDEENCSDGAIEITIIPMFAFHFYNFYLQVVVYADDWSKEQHEHFCKHFGVKLDSYKAVYVKNTQDKHEGEIVFKYLYEPLEFLGSDLLFDERVRKFYTDQTVLDEYMKGDKL